MGYHKEPKSCTDGLCGALDCPKCTPGCDALITCEGCAAEIYTCDAPTEWTRCHLCSGLFCENCFDAGLLVNIDGVHCFVCEDCVKHLVADALRDKAHDNKDPADAE